MNMIKNQIQTFTPKTQTRQATDSCSKPDFCFSVLAESKTPKKTISYFGKELENNTSPYVQLTPPSNSHQDDDILCFFFGDPQTKPSVRGANILGRGWIQSNLLETTLTIE